MDIITIHLNKHDLILAAVSIFVIGVCVGVLLIYGLSWIQEHLAEKRMERMKFERRMIP